MTAENIYLTCAVTGFLLSAVSILLHSGDTHHGGAGDVSDGGVDVHEGQHPHPGFSKVNFTTFTAFLAWFGGAGYLIERYSTLGFALVAAGAVLAGLIGGGIVFLIVSKVLFRSERNMRAEDFDMIGVLGRVSSPIRAEGIGEMIYSQQEARRAVAVRAENGAEAIPKDTEVVVTRYERGVAYVRRWDELSGLE
jgi:membrane protein implicated in regulation of membrane protease activity